MFKLPKRAIDLTGAQVGRLTVIKPTRKQSRYIVWHCVCECGVQIEALSGNLIKRHTNSCGCYQRERARLTNLKHGMTDTQAYASWCAMVQRCRNTNNPRYQDYGGRGIGVCESWLDFASFFRDMGERPSPNHSLERVDNSLGYSAENCKWATAKEQASNRRSNKRITVNGETRILKEWCQKLGLGYHKVYQRIFRLGWPPERALGFEI